MSDASVHVGDVGLQFVLTILDPDTNQPVNLSAATQIDLVFRRPDGGRLTVTTTFVTDGTDGQVQYVTKPGDLTIAGSWRVQAIVQWGSDRVLHSGLGGFHVENNL